MRILFVSPWVPALERPRSLGLIKMLAELGEVTAVVAVWNADDEAAAAALPASEVIAVPMTSRRGAVRAGAALASRRSLQQAYVDSRRLRRAVRDASDRVRPDLAYFNVIRSAQFFSEVSAPATAIDLDEFRSAYYEQMRSRGARRRDRLVGRIEAPRMKRAERKALNHFDRVLVSSPLDLDEGERGQVRLVRSPHALPGRADRVPSDVIPCRIVFVGRLSYGANVQAIRWFVDNVFPAVRARHPHCELDIVGADPDIEVMALGSLDGVNVVGRVPDVTPYYRRAAVSVVPVSMATGVQMKLIESLAVGVPTVCSSLVAEQAGVVARDHCLVADSASEWVDAVTSLFESPELAANLSASGARWAESNYSEGAIRDAFMGAMDLSDVDG